jgi:hypothetical protein
MSQENEAPHPTDDLPDDGQQALSALRNIWSAKEQTSVDIDESCGNTKACKSMDSVGFDGLVDEESSGGGTSVGGNVRSAWKTKLEREGKLTAGTGSVRDLVFGSDSKNK